MPTTTPKVSGLPRTFVFNGSPHPDPDPTMSVEEVRELLTPAYPKLATAKLTGTEDIGRECSHQRRLTSGVNYPGATLKRNRNQNFDWLESFDGDFLMKNARVLGFAALLVSALLTGCSHPQPVAYAPPPPPAIDYERFRTRVITMASRRPNAMLKAVSLRFSIITRAGAILRRRLRVLRLIERASARGIHGSSTQDLLPVTDLGTGSSYAPTDCQS
jgi:PRTRC genetic system protein C